MAITKQGIVLGATAAMLTAVAVAAAGIHSPSKAFFQESPKELVDEVWQVIDRSYVDGTFNQIDWRNVRQEYLSKNYTNREDAYKAIRKMLEKLEDPYTRFMDPAEFKSLQVETSGELTGIGIQIAPDEKTKRITVISPMEGTPAAAAGILAKDIVDKVDGKSTKGMDINDVVSLIRGKPGTEVTITVLRNNQQREFRVKRARIEVHPVRYSYQKTPTGGIGYIRLVQFSANAGAEMRNAIKDLESKKVNGYILDLRSNPGGLLFSSVEIAQMWLNEGTIVSTVDRQGQRDLERANSRALTNKPLVVLVDGGSASASEILSGALQDNKRATLVGTKTFGKGLVQSVRPLGDGSGMAVTIAKYFTPKGRDINHAGIAPDIVLELTEKQKQQLVGDRTKVGTPGDPQYDKALSVLNQKIAASRGPRAESVR
ncbi:carboxyl-terminal processing protease CtpC [Aliterella atlantica]|uniref:Carboxyl-terminal-processing protease n=1 Tax=Aliterella atlantica CENA595 TaxID=1618023 RepID=A0A0D8ZSR7_9CYAN|nr:carboxyl-terminal processing protease CtpC [Aliterella atlantica]KJH71407.1 peptidase S41 [Aliterella atlantica CENA595]